MASLAVYLIGFIVLIAGLAMGASLLGVSETWILVGVLVLVGLMIISMASRLNHRR